MIWPPVRYCKAQVFKIGFSAEPSVCQRYSQAPNRHALSLVFVTRRLRSSNPSNGSVALAAYQLPEFNLLYRYIHPRARLLAALESRPRDNCPPIKFNVIYTNRNPPSHASPAHRRAHAPRERRKPLQGSTLLNSIKRSGQAKCLQTGANGSRLEIPPRTKLVDLPTRLKCTRIISPVHSRNTILIDT
jgi:hypothetical protein